MPLTLKQLTAEALLLPAQSRVLLADRLVESLDSGELDDIQLLWTAEAIRRRDEIRSGQVKAIPGEQVLEEVRRLVGRGSMISTLRRVLNIAKLRSITIREDLV